MKKVVISAILMSSALAGAQSVTFGVSPVEPFTTDIGVAGGYYGGGSVELSVTGRNLGGSSIGLRGTVALTGVQGFNQSAVVGSAGGANITAGQLIGGSLGDASGNPPQTSRNITVGLDALFRLGYDATTGLGANVYVGPRYNLFTNTVSGPLGSLTSTSNQLGIGGGLLASVPVSGNVYLTGDLGVDRFFDAPIVQTGRDTNGATTGTTTFNPGTADYGTTNGYINQPETVFKARVGLAIRF
ncbi:hypothetical protein [Deinococcus yavapaiensis]|uniref:Outer membrane protein with beta-barrel domain n=1 Tax=Deinococcus yavapaiensis KR-236 TaxID=694435 RepID=A0A318S8Y8_9DEIO|nr:hypothetical protein [Deinococcus yavapaiensis]PYE52886.1 hypothetical protein DES52_11158 [Deinococcus yavapaiensis KR-236]